MSHNVPVLFVYAFLWLGLVPIARDDTPPLQTGSRAAKDSEPPLSDEGCKKFADDLKKAIASGDVSTVSKLANWDADRRSS